MANAFGVEQDSVEEIQIGRFPVPIGLAGVEEEWNARINAFQFVCKFGEGFPFIFLADQVEAS